MKKKHLQSILQEHFETFEDPDIRLEQYQTSAEFSAKLLYDEVHMRHQEIEGKFIADLGCGCGTFAIGASLLNAGMCIGFDIDRKALDVASINSQQFECNNVDFIEADVLNLGPEWTKAFDTVIMNPPFGTKNNQGTDMLFLRTALKIARVSVYSIHKTATREHVLKVAKSWKVNVEELYQEEFNLDEVYRKHRHERKKIDVDVIKFTFPR